MKRILFAAIAALSISLIFAFAKKQEPKSPKQLATYFYKYNSSALDQTNIQKNTNYIRADEDCESGDENVCGIYLPTDQGPGQPALSSDFTSTVQNNLWDAQSHAVTTPDASIRMKE